MDGMLNVVMRHKVMAAMVLLTALAVVANLVAMQMTDEVSWSAFDFAALTVFLLGVGLVIEVATAAFRSSTHKVAIGAVVAVAAAVVFVELAVGLVGSPIAGS
jgi:hypothetical protein